MPRDEPAHIGYVNALMARRRLAGDKSETQAVKSVLAMPASRVMVVSSTKSMTGHLLRRRRSRVYFLYSGATRSGHPANH